MRTPPRTRRQSRTIALAALTLGLLVSVLPVQAGRASCASAPPQPDDTEAFQRLIASAPVIFIGTVLSADYGGRLARVRVDGVWKGADLPQTVEVRGGPGTLSPTEHSSSDRTYAVGQSYLFVPTNQGPPFQDNVCTATVPYTSDLVRYAPSTAQPIPSPISPSIPAEEQAVITLSPNSGAAGAAITVGGLGFAPGDAISIEAVPPLPQASPRPPGIKSGGTHRLAEAAAGADGTFAVPVVLGMQGPPPGETGYCEIFAYAGSFGDRTAERTAAAPRAFFTVLGSAQLPQAGKGGQLHPADKRMTTADVALATLGTGLSIVLVLLWLARMRSQSEFRIRFR